MSEKNNNILCGAATAVVWKDNNIVITADDPHILSQFLHSHGFNDAPPALMAAIHLGPPAGMQGVPEYIKFAQRLNGRQIGHEISTDEQAEAKEKRLVVVFGYSDDCAEFRGSIYDEVGIGEINLTSNGKLLDRGQLEGLLRLQEDGLAREVGIRVITAKFTNEGHSYETDIPHAPFEIMEDGELYCRGIVFSIDDL